jgi:hypothetical protein
MAGRKRLDTQGLLVGSTVLKDHVVQFDSGRTVVLLVSPKGEVFLRITRDANRTREVPKLPDNWRLIEDKLARDVEFKLIGESFVIRTDNQDSFQGPVDFDFEIQQNTLAASADKP